MMAIDTSAVLAIILEEPEGASCSAALQAETDLVMSAGTLVELLVVADSRGIAQQVSSLVGDLGIKIEAVTEAGARAAAAAHARWGRGRHASALNFGDCFAYALAAHHDCPLLYIGNDFSRTDVKRALPP